MRRDGDRGRTCANVRTADPPSASQSFLPHLSRIPAKSRANERTCQGAVLCPPDFAAVSEPAARFPPSPGMSVRFAHLRAGDPAPHAGGLRHHALPKRRAGRADHEPYQAPEPDHRAELSPPCQTRHGQPIGQARPVTPDGPAALTLSRFRLDPFHRGSRPLGSLSANRGAGRLTVLWARATRRTPVGDRWDIDGTLRRLFRRRYLSRHPDRE